MPARKSDPTRKSNASTATLARFAPIEDNAPTPAAPPTQTPTPTPAPMQAPAPTPHASGPSPAPSPALALPTMDTSMPPPSLPPPGSAQTPDAVAFQSTRPGSGSAASVPSVGGAPSHTTPSSDKGKEREEGGKSGPGGHPKEAVTVPIEELQLPKSIITRLAKGVLPPNTQIQANAILAMTKSATVFINHLANAANEATALGGKKTIMPSDVFRALDDIEYGFMRERVEAEFARFNETQTTKRSAYRKKVAAAKKGTKGSEEGGADTSVGEMDGDTEMAGADMSLNSVGDSTTGGGQHRAKKARTDGNGEGDSRMDVDDELNDASDPEDVPDEEEEEEDDEDDDEEEDAQEEEEDEEEDQDGGKNEEEQDELEERENRPDDDEALDDGNNSD